MKLDITILCDGHVSRCINASIIDFKKTALKGVLEETDMSVTQNTYSPLSSYTLPCCS